MAGWNVWRCGATIACLVLALVGCSVDGRPLRNWKLDGGGDVHLPGVLVGRALLLRELDLVLRADVALEPSERGRDLTIVFDCYHGALALSADGHALVDTGDTGVGEHSFAVPAALTDRPALALALAAHQDNSSALVGLGAAPRMTVSSASHAVAAFNRHAGLADVVMILTLGLVYGALYLLDRRRKADGAFALGAFSSLTIPLWGLGVLDSVFGSFSTFVTSLASATGGLALIAFLRLSFELGPYPRKIALIYAVGGALGALGPLFFPFGSAASVFLIGAQLPLIIHFGPKLARISRGGEKRFDATVILGAMLVASVGFVLGGLGVVINGALPFGAWHVELLCIPVWGIAQSLTLARQHVARSRALERTAVELQHQVAERSRELADALAQIADRAADPIAVDWVVDGRYRVLRRLGAGGMGTVYEVERVSDRERFALKTLRDRDDSAQVMARFAREAQIASELHHPNLVPVVDVGLADGRLFLVMPVIAGGSLEAERKRFGDLAWAQPRLAQIAAGLSALHERGIVHRDLKPGNVLLDRGVARIADFGLASPRARTTERTLSISNLALDPTESPRQAALTQAGDVLGTPGYIAPELATGVQDARSSSDLFAFGVLAYEMVSGRAAFHVAPVIDRLAGRTIATPAPLAGKPDAVAASIMRCLDLDPAKRPTADELARTLAS